MATAIRTIGHEDRLSLVDHLDELRTRLIVSGVVLAVAFGVCLWQNHALLDIINKPLTTQTQKQVAKGAGHRRPGGPRAAGRAEGRRATRRRRSACSPKPGSGLSAQARAQLLPLIASLRKPTSRRSRATRRATSPVTLGVGEPFTTTITVALYFALIFSLPVILFELYGFMLPALKPNERRAARCRC